MNIGSPSQPTDFTLDVLRPYICNTFDQALANSAPPDRVIQHTQHHANPN